MRFIDRPFEHYDPPAELAADPALAYKDSINTANRHATSTLTFEPRELTVAQAVMCYAYTPGNPVLEYFLQQATEPRGERVVLRHEEARQFYANMFAAADETLVNDKGEPVAIPEGLAHAARLICILETVSRRKAASRLPKVPAELQPGYNGAHAGIARGRNGARWIVRALAWAHLRERHA